MTAPAYFNNGKMLRTGVDYLFAFIRVVKLQDDQEYMVMEDPFGIRHMVPFACYRSYKLVPGSTVLCRVDKINCTGRVYLEPEHPVYKRGETVRMPLIGNLPDSGDSNTSGLRVRDVFGNELVPEGGHPEPGMFQSGMISVYIAGFRKGKPLLRLNPPAGSIDQTENHMV